jgi:hypothetical protein
MLRCQRGSSDGSPGAGVVQRADARLRPGHLGEPVGSVFVVLAGEPLAWELRQPVVEVTGDEQGRRIKGVPARSLIVRDVIGDHRRALLPQAYQVDRLSRQPGDLVDAMFRTRPHPFECRPGKEGRVYQKHGIPVRRSRP